MQPENFLSVGEAADYLSISVRTLASWRGDSSESLAYIKIGRLVKYRKSDLDSYIDANTFPHSMGVK